MAKEITLTLEGQIYPVLRCTYGFNREVDYRGRPTTGLLGGDIQLGVESTGDDYLWEKLLGKKPRPVSGKVEIVDSAKMTPVRILEWYDGYIYAVEERMSSLFAIPMIQQIRITTERLDINRDIKLDRRFPQTYGFWWEEYKEPEPVVVTEETSEPEEEQTPEVTAVSWLSEEKDTLTIIPRDLEETVTLHVETSGFDKPGNDDEDVLIRIKDEEGETLLNYNTHPNQEGEINLQLSIHDLLSERHKNPTEYLKQHPELKLSFFAAWEQTPDEAKEAILSQEAQCTVKFRRDGTYHPVTAPHSYKGDFLFDWYREGDDDAPLCKWYNDPTMMDKNSFNEFMNNNYTSFEEEWKKTHPTYQQNYKYAVPVMTIVPGFTASLRLKLTVETPVDKIDFRFTGGDEDTFSLNFHSFSIKNKNQHHYHSEKLQITCNKVFSETMFLEACIGEQVVGKLEFIPNHEPYKMDISIIPVKLCDKDLNEFEISRITDGEVERMKQLFQQLYIFPDIHILPPLDCTGDKYPFRYNSIEKQAPLFTASFLLSENNKSINYTKRTR
ncbi:MAG: hypothetical protein LUE98_09040 [Tannerellaceae bacterium]|nr:hypothetical protein [Tannerellaceae bacterium]